MGVGVWVCGRKQEGKKKRHLPYLPYQPYLPLICYRYHQLISQPCMQPGLLFERQQVVRVVG